MLRRWHSEARLLHALRLSTRPDITIGQPRSACHPVSKGFGNVGVQLVHQNQGTGLAFAAQARFHSSRWNERAPFSDLNERGTLERAPARERKALLLESELSNMLSQLSGMESEFTTMKSERSMMETERARLGAELAARISERGTMETELVSMMSELGNMKAVIGGIDEIPKALHNFAKLGPESQLALIRKHYARIDAHSAGIDAHNVRIDSQNRSIREHYARIDAHYVRIDAQKIDIALQQARITARRDEIWKLREVKIKWQGGMKAEEKSQLLLDLRQKLSVTLGEPVTAPLPWYKYQPTALTSHCIPTMCGKSRNQSLSEAKLLLRDTEWTKEAQALNVLTSAPRQGKSRWLDELAKALLTDSTTAPPGPQKLFPICITYTGHSRISPDDSNPQHFLSLFFARALLSLVGAQMPPLEFLARKPCLAEMHSEDFCWIVQELFDTQRATIVFLVDEFSKLVDEMRQEFPSQTSKTLSCMTALYGSGCKFVFTGFKTSLDWELSPSASGRVVVPYTLPLVDRHSQSEYAPIKEEIEHLYKEKGIPFPGFLYESVKAAPGLMGHWLEEVVRCDAFPTEVERLNTPWSITMEKSNHTHLAREQAEGYFRKWAQGVHVGEYLEHLSNCETPMAILTERMGITSSFKPHPYPFVLLSRTLNQPRSDLFEHYRCLCAELHHFINALGTATVEDLSKLNGYSFEVVVLRVLAMKFTGNAELAPSSYLSWLTIWLGDPIFGEERLYNINFTTPRITIEKVEALARTPLEPNPLQTAPLMFSNFTTTAEDSPSQTIDLVVQCWESGLVRSPMGSPGFDVAGFLPAQRLKNRGLKEEGFVMISVECKCPGMDDSQFLENVARKFFSTLCGLLNTLEKMCDASKKQRILHLSYVVVSLSSSQSAISEAELDLSARRTSPFYNPSWGEPSIDNLTLKLKEIHGTTVGLNVVRGADACCKFLTPVVYHLLPDDQFLFRKQGSTEFLDSNDLHKPIGDAFPSRRPSMEKMSAIVCV